MGDTPIRRPNIVLIMSDDLGYEALSCNGSTSYKTPVLDKLAETGMRFENAHVMPLCTPTRISLMTGKYNFRNYIGFGLLDPTEITFGHIFSDAGYKTLLSGKWQLRSYNPPEEFPENRNKGQRIEDAGFDEYCVWHAHHTEEKGSRYKDPVVYENGKYRDDTTGKYGEDIFVDYINDFVERNKDEEFFVYWPMALTHGPFEPTPDHQDYDSYDPPDNRTVGGKTWDEINRGQSDPKYYGDMVEYHDKVIGRLVDKLDQLNLREDTLIIYLGDNGTDQSICSMEHNHIQMCGGKGLTLDRGTHVPLIVNGATTKSGRVCDDLIDNCDYLPTIMAAAGISTPENFVIDGQSFLPQLQGDVGKARDWIYFHFEPMVDHTDKHFETARFIRSKRWKLYDDDRLYDLLSDPEEECALLPEIDDSESSQVRAELEPIFDEMVR